MKVFLGVVAFEVRNRIWRWSSLSYFLIFFSLSYLMAISFAGAFHGVSVNFGLSNKLALNSPVVLNFIISFLGYLALLIAAPLFGQAVFKDFAEGFYQILFTTPISKVNYFFGRYLGAFLSLALLSSSFALGIFVATWMPFVDRSLIAPSRPAFYLMPYVTLVWPNFLIFGAIFTALVVAYKKMVPVYVASVAVFTGWLVAQSLTSDLENKFLAALVEPLGMEGASQVVRYWSVTEQSQNLILWTGPLLWNRLLWSLVGLLILGFGYALFKPTVPSVKRGASLAEPAPENLRREEPWPVGVLNPESWAVFRGLAWSEFRQAFSNIYFLMILLCGVLYILAVSSQVGKIYGTETLPTTYHVLELVGGSFSIFVVILVAYYAGELVWKDRDLRFAELVDSKPISPTFLYGSKLLSLVILQFCLMFLILASCLVVQISKGYFHFEFSEYFKTLFVYGMPSRLYMCVLALFFSILAPNKYIGHGLMVGYYVCLIWLPSLGWDQYFYLVNQLPRWSYSDMNGFGESAEAFLVLAAYWGFFNLALLVLSILMYPRGTNNDLAMRLREMRRRIKLGHVVILTTAGLGFLAVGGFIYYNTHVLNPYRSKAQIEHAQVRFETDWKRFATISQPQLMSVKLVADLFPSQSGLKQSGVLTYKNASHELISNVMLNLNSQVVVEKLQWDLPAQEIKTDPELGVHEYKFEPPLRPGQVLHLDYAVSKFRHGFPNSDTDRQLVRNGSFFYGTDFGPSVGYDRDREIVEPKTRRKYQLPDRARMPNINSKADLQRTYVSTEGAFIDFEAELSTDVDQTALAPGALLRHWQTSGRNHFVYKSERPMLDFYSVLSGRYLITKDRWHDVEIEIYSHPSHTANIARMIEAVKKSLDYYTTNFSPYQFHQIRIVEFPRYQMFAQSFPNSIPFSEGLGFIAHVNLTKPDTVDYVFDVTAHEMAHQWWAYQVIGANVQGSTMLSESLAQYSAFMVLEKEYGPKQMKTYLKYELDRYLSGRAAENQREWPLGLNENQPYIHYNKGSLVFYALKDALGERVVNQVLHDYLRDEAFKGPPFTRSTDLVERLRAAAPENQKYLIKDLFETVTLYDNRAISAQVVKNERGYRLTLVTEDKKIRADGQGKETEIPMDEWLDVGVLDAEGKYLILEKMRTHSGRNTFELQLQKPPARAGIDPLNKLIDRVPDDNLISVSGS